MFIVLGKNGYIGSAFVKYFEREEIPHLALSRGEVNYTDLNTLKEFLHKNKWNTSYNLWQVEGIINCAGFIGKPNVDACEDHKNETLLGNTHLPAGLAQLCGDMDIPFIHISSGCIFTGYDKQFSEQDAPNFTFDSGGSFYSGTKALAEQLIARTNKNSYIFRLRIPYDEHASPRNYITKMMQYNQLLDLENSMSHRDEFVQACIHAVIAGAPYGIYNVTNPGSTTTRDVVELIKKHLTPDAEYTFYDNEEDFLKNVKAPRSNCVLNTDKINSVLEHTKFQLTPLVESIETSIKNYC